jgi:hypothetical protein
VPPENTTRPDGGPPGALAVLAPCFAWRQSAANHHGTGMVRSSVVVLLNAAILDFEDRKTLTALAD